MRAYRIVLSVLITFANSGASLALGNGCLAPIRPFAPADREAIKEYRDIIRDDYETYLREVTQYFLCLDDERRRVFSEAKEVSDEYNQFIQQNQ